MKDERRSPLVAQVILMVLFAILTGVGVFTVVVPELSEDSETADGEDGEAGEGDEAGEDDEGDSE